MTFTEMSGYETKPISASKTGICSRFSIAGVTNFDGECDEVREAGPTLKLLILKELQESSSSGDFAVTDGRNPIRLH